MGRILDREKLCSFGRNTPLGRLSFGISALIRSLGSYTLFPVSYPVRPLRSTGDVLLT